MLDDKKLYIYVARMIRVDIYNCKYKCGDKLPSLLELCHQYDVGRNTVRSALNLLKEDGYVTMRKGTQATVVFDISNFEYHEEYKLALIDSRQMTSDIFETMIMIYPEFGCTCLSKANEEQIELLNERVRNFSVETITNERELVEELYGIYLQAFSFLDNPLLNDLFLTMMNSVYQPLMNGDEVQKEFQRNMKMIKSTLTMFFKFVKSHNKFMIKNGIAAMCKSIAKVADEYIDEVCEGMEPKHDTSFIWVINRNQEYLYSQLVLGVLRDVYYRVYQQGTILPSIAKLSSQYNVSEKTTRKALEVLREFHVIETINGVGSRVIINDFADKNIFMSNPVLKDNIKNYYYSLELLTMILHAIMPICLKQFSDEQYIEIRNTIEHANTFTLEPLYVAMFAKCNSCLQSIYKELMKQLGYSVFVDRIIDGYSDYDFAQMKSELLDAIDHHDKPSICKISHQINTIALTLTKQLISEV